MIYAHLRVSQCKMPALQYLGKRVEKAVFDWKWISRPLEIFSLLLMHLCKRIGNFCLSLDARQSLAGKQSTTQLLSRALSSYSAGTFGVHGGELCWDSTASMALLVRLARCLSAFSFWINNLSCLWGHCHVMFLPGQKQDLTEKQLLNLA